MANFNKHVIIMGSARSGTSWLSETLAQQHRYRILFEPEQETRTRRGYLLCDQWIRSSDEAPEAYRYLNDIFANSVDCDWIAQNSNRQFKRHLWPFIPKKYIIKFVRANLLAHFINEAFNIPILYLIRNPYDVLDSQRRKRFPWLVDLHHFQSQEKLVDLILDRFQFDLRNLDSYSPLELLTIRWCIENVIPLEVFGSFTNLYRVVKFEALVDNIELFYDLCNSFDLKPVTNLEAIYKRPSSKTHYASPFFNKEHPSFSFNNHELKQINTILDCFQTQLYPRVS